MGDGHHPAALPTLLSKKCSAIVTNIPLLQSRAEETCQVQFQ